MAKSFAAWKRQTLGHKIDLDNQSFDCVDVSKSWAEFGVGKPWAQSLCWGNAKDLYNNCPTTYWQKIPKGNRPQPGDIVVMNGQVGGGYGHTGVVVSVDGNNMTIYQQDTFTQVAVYTGVFGWNASYITGFLRPKFAFTLDDAPVLAGYQRQVVAEGVKYRKSANTSAEVIDTFDPGATVDFKGYVRGQNIDGNNIWFVGRYTGGFAWSGGFTDTGMHDLTDLTPSQLVIKPNQRQVGNDAMNYRKEPQVAPDNVIRLFNPGEVITFDGWIHGQNVDGNDIWFRVADTGGFVWSGGFVDSSTHDLVELKQVEAPSQPTYPAPTNDPTVTSVYNKKRPLGFDYEPTDLTDIGNGQKLRREAADSLRLMQRASLASGATLSPQSGYRSYSAQKTVYDNWVAQDGKEKAETYSARPGYSEHQTGLTVDFAPIDDAFKIGNAYKWLIQNAHKFGWVLRYPEAKVDVTGYIYEPWHWRYVGVDAATDMKAQNVATLEEYYGIQGGAYPSEEPKPDPKPKPNPDPTPETPKEARITLAELKTVATNVTVTFVQAFLATLVMTGGGISKAAVGGAIGGAASVVWNTIIKPFLAAKQILKK